MPSTATKPAESGMTVETLLHGHILPVHRDCPYSDAVTWWSDLFDDWFADLMFGLDDDAGAAAFLVERLSLKQGMTAFDQCCGIGGVALRLAEQGIGVIGVDQAAPYVSRARAAARDGGLSARFVVAEVSDFVPDEPVHGAFNWGMSFGYHETDEQNQAVLARAFETLLPGGRFVLDTTNAPAVLRTFQYSNAIRRSTGRGDVLLLRENTLDLARGRVNQHWTYLVNGGVGAERWSSVRLYLPDAVIAMLRRAGFVGVEIFGNLRGAPVGLDSQRMIAVGRKPL